jgi:hypothetical protein
LNDYSYSVDPKFDSIQVDVIGVYCFA